MFSHFPLVCLRFNKYKKDKNTSVAFQLFTSIKWLSWNSWGMRLIINMLHAPRLSRQEFKCIISSWITLMNVMNAKCSYLRRKLKGAHMETVRNTYARPYSTRPQIIMCSGPVLATRTTLLRVGDRYIHIICDVRASECQQRDQGATTNPSIHEYYAKYSLESNNCKINTFDTPLNASSWRHITGNIAR